MWRGALAVFAVVALAYLPCARYDFVEYDDTEYVVANPHVYEGLTPENVRWAFVSRGYAFNWHPATWISLMADASLLKVGLGGEIPKADLDYDGSRLSAVMHVHNVLLHAANAVLLFFLVHFVCKSFGMGREKKSRSRAEEILLAGLALLWALHPLRVEAVCWVSERKELLSVFFMLLTLLCYVGGEECQRLKVRGQTMVALFFFALAVMAKPVAVTLPVVLWTWDWLFRNKVRFVRFIPYAVLSAMTCVFTLQSQTEAMDVGSGQPLVSRLAATVVTPLVYIRQTLWPADLSLLYEATDSFNWLALTGGGLLVAVLFGVCVLRLVRRSRMLDLAVFGVAWVYVGLLPMLGIVKVGCQEHCDRYTYWVGCGVCVVLAMALGEFVPLVRGWLAKATGDRMAEEWRDLRKMCFGALAAALVALGFATWNRMPCWRNTIALFRDAVPKCWSTEIAKILALHLVPFGPEGIAEGEMHLRACANNHPNILAAQNLAEFLILFKEEDPSILAFGGTTYAEAEGLVKGILAVEPERKRAKELMAIIEERRKAK